MQKLDQANETFDRALEECEKFKNALVTELGGMPIASERSRLAVSDRATHLLAG